MKITANTKISVLIKANPASVEVIADLAKPFEKLHNPLLRKIMASRITIAEAANIGGVAVGDFVRVLSPLGFEFENEVIISDKAEVGKEPPWLLQMAPGNIENFDVREILDSGKDPFKQIMERYTSLETGHILCVINSFAPTPLIEILKSKGALSHLKETSPQVFHAYFMKSINQKNDVGSGNGMGFMVNEEDFNKQKMKFGDRKKDIDVRALEMPGPMQKILEALDLLPYNHVLYVLHKRVPVYLLEALADKDYEIFICNKADGDVRLLISKQIKDGRY